MLLLSILQLFSTGFIGAGSRNLGKLLTSKYFLQKKSDCIKKTASWCVRCLIEWFPVEHTVDTVRICV